MAGVFESTVIGAAALAATSGPPCDTHLPLERLLILTKSQWQWWPRHRNAGTRLVCLPWIRLKDSQEEWKSRKPQTETWRKATFCK